MLDLKKETILLSEGEGKELKSFNTFKELFVDLSKNNLKIKKLSNQEITVINSDNKEQKFSYAILSHTDLKENFEYEINEHRLKLKEKLSSLEEDGIFISDNELNKLNEQFSFLPENIIDN